MRRVLLVLGLLLVVPLEISFPDPILILRLADELHDKGRFAEAKDLLLGAIAGTPESREKAELFWRLARETLKLGKLAEKAGLPASEILKTCDEGEMYADKAIEADPNNDLGYYWKSANIGRGGQVRGVMNALLATGRMRDLLVRTLSLNPERSEAYFVLGQLYRELPGWPISFGNIDAAASFGRLAADMRMSQYRAGTEKALDYDFFLELARTLHRRNLSAATRIRSQEGKRAKYSEAKGPLDRGALYEAVAALKKASDREEARALVQWSISELEAVPYPTAGDAENLQKAKELLASW